jgi:signal transduction histidine kinase
LEVPWGGMLNVQFTLLDFSTSKHRYEYRVSSADVWRKLNDVRQLNFYKMAPGTHELEVRGTSHGGQWSEPARISIAVIPPWWRNPTYILLILLLATFLAIGYHKYRMAKWRRITKRLNNLKEEKSLVIEQLEKNEQQLKAAFEGMRKLASRLLNAKEEERKAISRELHDQFGQSLTAIQIGLQLYRRQHPLNSEPIDASVNNIQTMIKQVRAFSFDLRPSLLDDVGLTAATNDLIAKLANTVDYPIYFRADDNFPQLNPELSTTLFRVIQESLTNAIRHAQATRIEVSLSFDGSTIRSVISDNGIGFDVATIKEKISEGGHLGLLGVEERVYSQHGILSIETQPGAGTMITTEFLYET